MNINEPIDPHEMFQYGRSGCNDGPFKNLDRNSSMALARPSVWSHEWHESWGFVLHDAQLCIQCLSKSIPPVAIMLTHSRHQSMFSDSHIYIYTYTHCYIAVSNITMLFILEATARAIHQGSIRHTCRLSLEQLVCKFSTLIPDPFHIDNSDTLMFSWFFLIIFMWLKLHEIAAFDHVMARN